MQKLKKTIINTGIIKVADILIFLFSLKINIKKTKKFYNKIIIKKLNNAIKNIGFVLLFTTAIF